MVEWLKRDLVGYGGRPPKVAWPGAARLALNFVLNYEEGSEASFAQGDGYSETNLIEVAHSPVPRGERDRGAESMFEYGSRAGFWRILRLFQERRLTLTVFACAQALEVNAPAARAIADAGYDLCGHGWRWAEHFRLPEHEERRQIAAAVASLQRTIGRRPHGWYCRYAPSLDTRRLLAEEGGFLYDSDSYNDDLPYWTRIDGRPWLVIPYGLVNNDMRFVRGDFSTGGDFFGFVRDAIDLLRQEGRLAPKMLSVGLHNRLIGHPARAAGLQRLLDYVAGLDDVWVCQRLEIARHWQTQHPCPS
ncbi:MAG: chitin deacetylase [Alphaproteobacteria bacterium]|nr:chitin deacetylase [Alphaproteobacteria bacterium]